MARRKLDYQTFQTIVLLGVPSLAFYAYGKYTQKSPEELEKHLETNYARQVQTARRTNQALKQMFKTRSETGRFDEETEKKFDAILRGGKTKSNRQRINPDNVKWHEEKRGGGKLPEQESNK